VRKPAFDLTRLFSPRALGALGLGAAALCGVALGASTLGACGGTTSSAEPGSSSGSSSSSSSSGGSSGTDGKPVVTDLPCAVQTVLEKNCQSCHAASPNFGAPMPLVTRADLLASARTQPAKRVIDLALERTADTAKPMPPPPASRLEKADTDALAAWAAAGAPASSAACGATTLPPPVDTGVDCSPDLPVKPAVAWEMPTQAGDEYVCYGVDITRPTPTHVVGFAPRIDNTKIVHHIVLFESASTYPATPQKCDSGASLSWRMIMAWAPGGKGLNMPKEAGFPLKTSGATHYVVQMHYSNPQGLAAQKDTSGFDLCTSTPRAQEADVLAFGTTSISIPPNSVNFARTCSVKIPSQLAGLNLVAAMPHMHKLGAAMTTKLTPAGGGADVDLGTMPAYSFDTQAWLPLVATTKTNDVIKTTCTWTNPTGDTVKYGEKTADEMCYSFTVYYPKVQTPVWSWATPAYTSSCQ
jgi:hypothetical protein